MIKISSIESYIKESDKCPECEGKVVVNSFERICKECGLVINNFFKESAFVFNEAKIKNSLKKNVTFFCTCHY